MLRRPDHHLDRLTIEFRWEATRRHPVYIQLWQIQKTASKASPSVSWQQLRQNADIINACNAIRVVSEPADPALSYEELSEMEASDLFYSNALQPVTVKMVLGTIGMHLSADALRRVAESFSRLADGKDGKLDPKDALAAIADIINSVEPEMEAVIPAPFYLVSPVAPREQLQQDMTRCQKHWREKLNLETSRDRAGDYPNYFRAWDLCEAFCEGRYYREQAKSFVAVAKELKKNEATIRRWYHRAFFLITGHEFSNENWHSAMGFQQLSGFLEVTISPASRKRLKGTISEKRDVDFSTVQQDSSFLDTAPAPASAAELREICTLICLFIQEGLNDKEIMDTIEIKVGNHQDVDESKISDAIIFLRSRDDIRRDYLAIAEK